MIEGIYAAISGLEANQTMLDVVSNNLANLNTVGYKDQTVDFSSALSQVMSGAGGPTTTLGGTNPVEVGVGVNVQAIDTNESTGTMESTGNPLSRSRATATCRSATATHRRCQRRSTTPVPATSRPTPTAT